jgi:flagellar assembly protein FliH
MSSLPLTRTGRATGFEPDVRFLTVAGVRRGAPAPVAAVQTDPLNDAYENGYRDGAAMAAEDARQAEAERDAARRAIELAFSRLDADDVVELRERLRQTVLALCEAAVLPLAIDAGGLAARVERAVSMLQRAQDERTVRLHPEDLALVRDRLPGSLKIEPDPSVERGGLRIETADGGVEDGPSHWRRYLAEAFREC